MTYRYIYYTEHNVGMPGLDMPHTAEKEFISVLLAFMSPAEQQALEQQQFQRRLQRGWELLSPPF